MTQLKLNENIPNFILPSTTGETFSYETHQKEHQSWKRKIHIFICDN